MIPRNILTSNISNSLKDIFQISIMECSMSPTCATQNVNVVFHFRENYSQNNSLLSRHIEPSFLSEFLA